MTLTGNRQQAMGENMATLEENQASRGRKHSWSSSVECILPQTGGEQNNAIITAQQYQRLGERKETQFEYIAAEQCYLRAFELLAAGQTTSSMLRASAARSLSLLYSKTGRFSLARWYARRALVACLEEERDHPEAIKTMAFYGALLYRQGYYHSAARYLKRAYLSAKTEKTGHTLLLADLADLLADAYCQRGCSRRAAAYERISRRLRSRGAEVLVG
jgi:hypothetical protein